MRGLLGRRKSLYKKVVSVKAGNLFRGTAHSRLANTLDAPYSQGVMYDELDYSAV